MEQFIKNLESRLTGKTIKTIRYMTDAEASMFYWDKKPIVFILNDGTFIIPQRDDEGNNGGALAIAEKKQFTIIPTT